MIAFPMMLMAPAQEAGIKVPPDADDFDRNEYPHFAVFLTMQLGASMPSPTAHWENAKVVAGISEDKIRSITPQDLFDAGFQIGLA